MKRNVSILIIFLLFIGYKSNEQTVFKIKNSNLRVGIKMVDTLFMTSDSVKFEMTLTNLTKSTQVILFDKPSQNYPWSTNVYLRHKSCSLVKLTPWAFLSSQTYFENQLKEFHSELKTKQSISHNYYLGGIVRFDNKNGKLSKGTYVLQIIYDNNFSNKVTFTIK